MIDARSISDDSKAELESLSGQFLAAGKLLESLQNQHDLHLVLKELGEADDSTILASQQAVEKQERETKRLENLQQRAQKKHEVVLEKTTKTEVQAGKCRPATKSSDRSDPRF